MKKEELQKLDISALEKEVRELKKELFNLRLNASTMHVKDHSQFRKLRTSVAQTLTVLNQKKRVHGAQSTQQ